MKIFTMTWKELSGFPVFGFPDFGDIQIEGGLLP